MNLKWEWTIPNVLSLFRIALIPAFAILYLLSDRHPQLLAFAVGALVLSGLTDMFDGMIARKCNQITEIGKVLDPVADKLTQVTVLVCLAIRLPRLWPLVAVCVIKETLQSIGAALLMFRHKAQTQSAQWYGKVCTVIFYLAMALFVLFPPLPDEPLLFGWNMPAWLFFVIVGIVAVSMIFAFVQYARVFMKVSKSAQASTDSATAAP